MVRSFERRYQTHYRAEEKGGFSGCDLKNQLVTPIEFGAGFIGAVDTQDSLTPAFVAISNLRAQDVA